MQTVCRDKPALTFVSILILAFLDKDTRVASRFMFPTHVCSKSLLFPHYVLWPREGYTTLSVDPQSSAPFSNLYSFISTHDQSADHIHRIISLKWIKFVHSRNHRSPLSFFNHGVKVTKPFYAVVHSACGCSSLWSTHQERIITVPSHAHPRTVCGTPWSVP